MNDLQQPEPIKQPLDGHVGNPGRVEAARQALTGDNQPNPTCGHVDGLTGSGEATPETPPVGEGVEPLEQPIEPSNLALIDTNQLLAALGSSRNALKQWTRNGLKPASIGKNERNREKHFWKLEDVKSWLASRGNFEAIFKKESGDKESKVEKVERVTISKKDLNKIDPDFENVLKRIRLIEQRTFEHYQLKLESGSTMEILAAQKAYKDISTQRTKIELQAPEILKRQSKVIDKETVEKQLIEIALAIKQEFITIPNKLSSKLEMKSATEISDILKTELTDILRHISNIKQERNGI